MHETKTIHESVSRTYARALEGGGCCGSAPKGILARQAGYQAPELAAIPQDAVANSFGCGNPLAFSNVQPGDVVLDLGCGAGIDVVLAAAKVGPTGRVIGVDMTDEMIAKAREVVTLAKLSQVEIRKGLIEQLPVESATVDWVISNCVINLSPEKPRVFAEIARVLKPGGRAIISDIIAEDLPDAVRNDLQMHSCCIAGALSESYYRTGLERCGLVNVAIRKLYQLGTNQIECLLDSDSNGNLMAGEKSDSGAPAVAALAAGGDVWSVTISARKPSFDGTN